MELLRATRDMLVTEVSQELNHGLEWHSKKRRYSSGRKYKKDLRSDILASLHRLELNMEQEDKSASNFIRNQRLKLFHQHKFIPSVALKIIRRLNELERENDCWRLIHPEFQKPGENEQQESNPRYLYEQGLSGKAVLEASKRLEGKMREIYRESAPDVKEIPYGTKLVLSLFGFSKTKSPIFQFEDNDKLKWEDRQRDITAMFLWAVTRWRNLEGHSNPISISREEAMRFLVFASMLMDFLCREETPNHPESIYGKS